MSSRAKEGVGGGGVDGGGGSSLSFGSELRTVIKRGFESAPTTLTACGIFFLSPPSSFVSSSFGQVCQVLIGGFTTTTVEELMLLMMMKKKKNVLLYLGRTSANCLRQKLYLPTR